MLRLAIMIAFAIGLSACSASRPVEPAAVSLDQITHPQQRNDVRNSHARYDARPQPAAIAMLPPEAGRVVRVAQKSAADGVRQNIVYDQPVAGLGDSRIDVKVRTSNFVVLDEPLQIAKPTEAAIRAELASLFPRMTMQVVDRPRSNVYGPYGLAVGRWANGARCIYAWQWIDDVGREKSGEIVRPASVRVRLCRTGVTLDQMAGYLDRLRIDFEQHQAGDATTVVAEQAERADRIGEPKKRPVRRVARRAVHTAPVAALSAPRLSAAPHVMAAPVPPASQDGRDAPLDPSLPAAAYRGPTAASLTSALAAR